MAESEINGHMSKSPKARTWIVDSVSDDIVRIEQDKAIFHVPRWLCPAEAREGDLLRLQTSSRCPDSLDVHIAVDAGATQEVRRDLEERMRKLQGTDRGDDIEL